MDSIHLNICIVSQEFPPYSAWGGIAIYYQDLVKGLINAGHSVTVLSRFTRHSPRFEQEFNETLRIYRLGSCPWTKYITGRTLDKLFFSRCVLKKISILEKSQRYDIIETTETYLEGKKLINDPEYRNRTIIQCHGSNIIGVIPKGLLSLIHKFDFKQGYKHELNILLKSIMVIVPSVAGKNIILKNGISENKIELIYHGINTDLFKPPSIIRKSHYLEVAFVGKLHKMKGVDFIWKVLERIEGHSSIRFNLFGAIHPSEKKEVTKYLNKFSGFLTYNAPVSHSEMPAIYQSQHVLLQPSRFEQFGLVYAEAMASGLIVFAGNIGSSAEIVKNNVTGFLIDPDNDVDFVVNKLKEISVNQTSFNMMRNKARNYIVENFSQNESYKKKLDCYYKLSN